MKKTVVVFSLIMSILILPGCFFDCINPSGNVETITREVPIFTGIKFSGPGKVILHTGSREPLAIRGNENILPHLTTDVVDETLIIHLDKCVSGSLILEIDAAMPELKLLEISGSGKIIGNDTFKGNSIDLSISGSGSIAVGIDAREVSSHISGSGSITLSGQTSQQDISISGSGHLDGFDLISSSAGASISGSGRCELNVSSKLDVHISGSGKVIYKGAPEVRSSISGSGKVIAVPN